jgi:hypothetical protein
MLCCYPCGGSVGAPKDDWTGRASTRHVKGLATRVDDLIDSLPNMIEKRSGQVDLFGNHRLVTAFDRQTYLHGKVERHEFADRTQAGQGRSHCDPRKPSLRDRSIVYY